MSSTLTKTPDILLGMAADTAKKLRDARKGRRLTQDEMARTLRVKRTTYANWEIGIAEPPPAVMDLFEALYGADTQEGPRKGLRAEPSGKIKIYSSASAGDGNSSSPDLDELDVPQQFARDDYGALIVEGRSMEPFLEHGDTAIFRDWHEPKPGYVMAVSNEDGEWLIKLVQSSGKLRSLNTGYEPLEGQFRFHGFLVGIVRDTGPERMIRLNPFGLKPEVRG